MLDNATSEDEKEFYTIVTPDENVFYLVIDKQRDADNVYFLNAVTESDLMALAEKRRGYHHRTAGGAGTATYGHTPAGGTCDRGTKGTGTAADPGNQPPYDGSDWCGGAGRGAAWATTSRFINQSMNWTTLPILMNLSLRGRRKKPSGRKIWNPPN